MQDNELPHDVKGIIDSVNPRHYYVLFSHILHNLSTVLQDDLVCYSQTSQ